jgi:hypothetical protein
MSPAFKALLAAAYLGGIAGCGAVRPDSFIFTADLPPKFAYYAVAKYAPAKGETCEVTIDDNPYLGFNREWRTEYKAESVIPIYRKVKGCRLAIYRIDLEINATYWTGRGDFGGDTTAVIIREHWEDKYRMAFNTLGESAINGQCQWLFRTSGKIRVLRKILDCKAVDAQGNATKSRPIGAYTLDQLPGKTVKLNIKLAEEEIPGWQDTWIKVPNGWKRCMGKSYEDQLAFCRGNHKDFSTFRMPDGKVCSIYPGCTEQ